MAWLDRAVGQSIHERQPTAGMRRAMTIFHNPHHAFRAVFARTRLDRIIG
jgi:hypothetical protein